MATSQTRPKLLTVLSLRLHIDSSSKRCVNRYSAKHYHFILLSYSSSCDTARTQTLPFNYAHCMSPCALYLGLYLPCLCNYEWCPFPHENCPRLNNKLYSLLQTGPFQKRDRHEGDTRSKFIWVCVQTYCSKLPSHTSFGDCGKYQ